MAFWLCVRDRLLASPRFQDFAARFPLTRPIARRDARALFDLCAGFVYAQTLVACVELELFERLAAGPVGAETLAAGAEISLPAMLTLLNAAAALRLLAPAGGTKFRLGRLGAALRGNPGAVAMIRHHRLFYADLADPVALLRGQAATELGRFWPYRGIGEAAAYSALMAASQPMIAAQILAAYDFSRHRCLLDVGGGDGSFLAILAERAPSLRLKLFDLPPVAALARARFEASGLAARTSVHAGDFRAEPLPAGADIITLIRVLHDNDDATVLTLLRAARAALSPGGVLLIAEPMAGVGAAPAVGDAYFGFYLMAMGSGRPRRPRDLRNLLRQAGFGTARRLRTPQPMLTGIMIAYA